MNPGHFTSASVYVGDLHPDVNEAQLFDLFKQVGPVASIRVCRDAITKRSLGYAYVNYHNLVDAERAIDLLNYKDIKGRPCRIMWSQRDPSLRRSNVGNIFIKNLDRAIDNKTLYDTFSSFGNILSCKVAQDESGASKGFAFIHFETQEAAKEAIDKVDGKLLNGKRVFVAQFVPRKERLSTSQIELKWTNVYVKNLDKSYDEEKLRVLFEAYGPVTSVFIPRDLTTKESKGFGFINFEKHEDAERVVMELNEREIDGKQIYVGRAQKKSERERELRDVFLKLQRERASKFQGVNLYVKNLDDSINDDRLREAFAAFGTITSAKVMNDERGTSRGFGFVCFSSPEEATRAVSEMNGKMLSSKPLFVALAQKKEQRRVQLEAMHRLHPGLPMPAAGAPVPALYYAGAQGAPQVLAPQQQGPHVGMQRFVYPGQLPRGGPARFAMQQQVPSQVQAGSVPVGPVSGGPAVQGTGSQGAGTPMPGGPRGIAPSGYPLGPYGVPPTGSQQQPRGPPKGGRGPGMGGGPSGVPGRSGPLRHSLGGGPPAVPGSVPGYPGIKYNPNVRNPQQQPSAVPGPAQNPMFLQPLMGAGSAPTSALMSAEIPLEDRKQMIGENLFPPVQNLLRSEGKFELAGKITGMILESLDIPELIGLLESPDVLSKKVHEALEVLEQSFPSSSSATTSSSSSNSNGNGINVPATTTTTATPTATTNATTTAANLSPVSQQSAASLGGSLSVTGESSSNDSDLSSNVNNNTTTEVH